MDRETRKLLQEADWWALRSALLTYTIWRAGSYHWRRGENWELTTGYTVEDVVQEVIVKTLTGTRSWDPDKGQLLPWLQAQSRSMLDALAKSASHRREINLMESEKLTATQSLDPLEVLLETEASAQYCKKITRLVEAVEESPELHEVLQVILAGCEPWPRHIASELGISVREADNRLKRLRRRATKLSEEE